MKTYIDALTNAKAAYIKAINQMQPLVGQHPDPNVRIYNRLQPAHLDEMIHQYGLDAVGQYVTDMEARKNKGM